jgi:adenylate kinase family enzyme
MGRRYVVVGNSGSGKTHLARQLAQRLGLPHVELDALNHRAGWQEAPVEEFRVELTRSLASLQDKHGGWVVDGNYRGRVADLLDPDTYVWLDYPRALVFSRVVRRSLGRVLLRRELWNGNREQWRFLLSRDPDKNVVLWSWTNSDEYRRKYEAESSGDRRATWVRLRSPREARRWLSGEAGGRTPPTKRA